MRKLLVVLFVLALAITLTSQGDQRIMEVNVSEAGGNVPINVGTNGCVCKGTTCQDQNWISFREYCGYGDGTDARCADIHNGQCNN